MSFEPIAIIGMSGRFPEADDMNEFWENLVTGRDSIRDLPESRRAELRDILGPMSARYVKNGYLNQVGLFDAAQFGISPEEARFIDPQHRITLELVEEAIQNAGYRADESQGSCRVLDIRAD